MIARPSSDTCAVREDVDAVLAAIFTAVPLTDTIIIPFASPSTS
ncbi:MAG: hypothetical protein U1F17_04290 [Burkholderiaceae bacterium]